MGVGLLTLATSVATASDSRFFPEVGPVPTTYTKVTADGVVLIPAGPYMMGATTNVWHEFDEDEVPRHPVEVSAFYTERTEVTNDKMVEVLQWAYGQDKISVTSATVRNLEGNQQELLDLDDSDCRITWDGSQFGMKAAKGSGYPCVEVTWYGAVAFSNYRSEREGLTPCYNLSDFSCNWGANGYRLPTEAERVQGRPGSWSGNGPRSGRYF